MKGIRILFSAIAVAAASLHAADYHWTGAAGNGLWSDAGNWESSSGAAVAAPTPGTAYTYNFGTRNGKNVGWGGDAVVVQDVDVLTGTLAVNPATTDGETLTIVPAGGAKMALASNGGVAIYVQNGARLVLQADLSADTGETDIVKHGTGALVFDLAAANKNRRVLYIRNGSVELAEGGETPNVAPVGNFSASEVATATLVIGRDGAELPAVNVSATGNSQANARIYLGGNDLVIGTETPSTSLMNLTMPVFADGASLTFRNGRQAAMRGLPLGGTLRLGRADAAVGAAGTAVRFLFDDPSAPLRDDVGSGSRLLAPAGVPDVVQDAERGSVLSISGGKYLKGPDDNAGFAELFPQAANNAYTVAFWFKPAASCDNVGKIFWWGQNVNGQAAGLRLNNSKTQPLMFTVWGNNRTITAPDVRDGAWHHFAATFNGNASVNVYVDGANVDSFTQSGYAPLNRNFYVGAIYGGWVSNGANPYTGLLDDFLVASYEMRAEDVAKLVSDGLAATVGVGSFATDSSGVGAFSGSAVSLGTLSGTALAGGVELDAEGAALSVGVETGAAATEFKGRIDGSGATLSKRGADYALALSGPAPAVTDVAVRAGTLEVRRPTASPGLVAHYAFDDYTTPGRDSSPAGLLLSKTGSGSVPMVADGVSGSALRFGGSAYLSSANVIRPAAFPSGNASFTASVWIRPTAEACTGTVPVFSWGNPASHELMMLRFDGESSLMFSNWDADLAASGLALSDGEWHHVAVTYDGATGAKAIYFDGEPKAAQTVAGGIKVGAANPLMLGHCPVTSRASQYYTGDMDEFRLLDRAMTAAEVADEFARKAPASVAAAELVPAPIARYGFDGADPCADSSGSDHALAMQGGTVETVSGEGIAGKAAKFGTGSAFFMLPEYPANFPSGAKPYTVVVRYRPDAVQPTAYAPAIVMLGDAAGWNTGKCLKFSTGNGASSGGNTYTAFRSVVSGNIPAVEGLYYGSAMATERARWMVATVVVASMQNASEGSVSRVYIDGELVRDYPYSISDITPQGFAIGSNAAGAQNFHGLVDEVQVYDVALSPGQVRLVAEALEAAKGTDAAPAAPESVLAAEPAVTVASGATLRIASNERVASLSGAGNIEIASGARLEVAAFDGFAGAFSGAGTLAVADGATIDFGSGASPVADFGGTVALGENVVVSASLDDGARHALFSASSFSGAGNLAGWTLADGKPASFRLSADGSSVTVSKTSPFVLVVR